MRIVAIANQKGGVGKTTTAVNLSACLALRGQRVLLVDLDPQANATLGTGHPRSLVTKSIYRVLLGESSLADVLLDTAVAGLMVAPAQLELAEAELALAGDVARPYLLRNALRDFVHSGHSIFDVVLVDCPPTLGLLTQNALVAADLLIIPVDARFYSLAGIDDLTKLVTAVRQKLDHRIELLGVLLNLVERTTLHAQVTDEIKIRFGAKVFSTVIAKNIAIAEAEAKRCPVIHHAPHSSGALNFGALADEVLERWRPMETKPEPRGREG